MAIEWLAGNRLRGTTAERPNFGLPSGSVGGWVELGRTTLGGAADSISVSSLSDKRYYMFLLDKPTTGDSSFRCRLNSDSGTNYARRYSINGGTDTTATSQDSMYFSANQSHDEFSVGYLANLSAKEKLVLGHTVAEGGAGAGNDPERSEFTAKWTNTSSAVDEITAVNLGSGSYNTGSELVVLGWDPADSHTTNFWEELASVELSSAGDNLSTGTFTAKKYLWVQVFLKASGSINTDFTFNNDTGSNYSERWSINGGADGTATSSTKLDMLSSTSYNEFANMFIINNSSNEKLVITHQIGEEGSGAGTAPRRQELVGKWSNTSSQITEIDFTNAVTGDFDSGSIVKVWGAD